MDAENAQSLRRQLVKLPCPEDRISACGIGVGVGVGVGVGLVVESLLPHADAKITSRMTQPRLNIAMSALPLRTQRRHQRSGEKLPSENGTGRVNGRVECIPLVTIEGGWPWRLGSIVQEEGSDADAERLGEFLKMFE